jgi:ABC-type dipeptide/oligopeptide/nickel transport system ATPase subunit
MPSVDLVKEVEVNRTTRVKQIEGMFDVPEKSTSSESWSFEFELPDEWSVGLIVGPSGCGKSTIARELWPDRVYEGFDWPESQAVVDGFRDDLSIKKVTEYLSKVGFSSPPLWMRPYHVLSTGERFRCDLARALSLDVSPIAIDEFTSVVDRDVGQVGSAAVAKTARKFDKQFVAVTCHHDVIEWLQPDWIMRPERESFEERPRGDLQRPDIKLDIRRCSRGVWRRFRDYHYLDESISDAAKCFVSFWRGRAVAFTAVCSFPHPHNPAWREHRTVCLPNYQGVGIGNTMSNYVASLFASTEKSYYSTTSHPAMISVRNQSSQWALKRAPGHIAVFQGSTLSGDHVKSKNRLTSSFEWAGPAREDAARRLGVVRPKMSR